MSRVEGEKMGKNFGGKSKRSEMSDGEKEGDGVGDGEGGLVADVQCGLPKKLRGKRVGGLSTEELTCGGCGGIGSLRLIFFYIINF